MWNRKQDEPPKPTPVRQTTPTEPVREMQSYQPPAAAPPQTPVREAPRATAGIGQSVKIVGEIFSAEELFIDGEVEGVVVAQARVTIGQNGKVKAHVRAKEVVIQGSVNGNVEAGDKITIRKTGSLVGDIKTGGIVVDDGAYFKGSIDIVKAPPIVVKTEKSEPATPVR